MDSIRRMSTDPTIQKDAVQRTGARRRPRGEDGHEFGDELERTGADDESAKPSESASSEASPSSVARPRPRNGEVGSQLDVTG